MNAALLIMQVFCKGQEIGRASNWKSGQIAANQVAGIVILIPALMKAFFNYEMPGFDDETALMIATSLLALFNCVVTVITSKKVGLPAGWFGSATPAEVQAEKVAEAVETIVADAAGK